MIMKKIVPFSNSLSDVQTTKVPNKLCRKGCCNGESLQRTECTEGYFKLNIVKILNNLQNIGTIKTIAHLS